MKPSGLSRNEIKIIAFIVMVIDHCGAILFPQHYWIRIIGRISFPIFAFMIADGILRTSNEKRMLIRLFLFSLVSQIPYSLAFYNKLLSPHLNIFFTLFFGAVNCSLFKKIQVEFENKNHWTALATVVFPLSLFISNVFHFEYGMYGILLICGFYFIQTSQLYEQHEETQPLWCIVFLGILGVFYWITENNWIQIAAAYAGLMLPYQDRKEKHWGIKAYFFYPVHLLLIYLIVLLKGAL